MIGRIKHLSGLIGNRQIRDGQTETVAVRKKEREKEMQKKKEKRGKIS